MRRFSPKARGRAGSIRKTSSIIRLELGSKAAPKAEKPAAKKSAKKAAKKAVK
jgi:hypothetical protein